MNTKTLILATVALLTLGMAGCNNSDSKQNPEAAAPVIAEGGLKIAYVDTDTIMAKYQYAIDLNEELLAYKDQQEKYYQQQMTQFQTDYNNYLQTGASLTLTQQQAKEAELKQRMEKMSTLEQELMAKVAERQLSENTKLLNAIFAFIREYNAANQQFDVILRKSFNDTPVLYANPAMDITEEILTGLNEEYKSVKGKK
ncbi:MAG: OmpH family outer membrane protein [Bacteroidales bacterium]|nr:OmpH family outer membrane protein [Bacteroidales bacterium]